MSALSELKPYLEKLSTLSVVELISIFKAYGMAAITEITGLPDEGDGVMTKKIYAERKTKCAACPLKTKNNTCDPSMSRPHATMKNDDGSAVIVKGCGCGLWAKQNSYENHCPAGEW